MSPDTPPAAAPVLSALREALPALNPTMHRVASAILADPLAAGSVSITDLAARTNASPSTLSRLATKLGYTGFPQLRSAIAVENGRNAQDGWARDIGSAITPEDPASEVLDILAGTAARALREAAATIDIEAVQQAARAIARAERVHLYGDWGDAVAMRELHMRLQRIGVPAWFLEGGPTAVRTVASTLTRKDALVVLSRSGDDEVSVELLREAGESGAATVALHGEPGATVDREAAISIFTGIRNGEVWTHYYSGRASDTLTTSLLWVLVAQLRSSHGAMGGLLAPDLTDPRPGKDDPA